jgi:limonene-1,2-epoxide hydrolase
MPRDDADTDTPAANDRLVREFVAAWEQRDSDFIIGCLTEDATYHAMPLNPIEGKEAIAAWVRHFEDVQPGSLDVHHQIASGDVVMNERTDRIVLNGHPVTLPITAVFELDDGRIRAWREYFDQTAAKEAYTLPPG